ncbi:MAG: tRNA (N6-isopentenyl adenosine(37)-C2)-methylthiotransferase MiaB [Candidatus Neomarinimicrobiota bacterium]
METYGCQMNVADTEVVAGLLNQAGYRQTSDLSQAQVILLNTCAIREKAEATVQNRLAQLAHLKRNDPGVLIGVLGCMAQHLADNLLESKPYVDFVLGPDSYRHLPEIIAGRQDDPRHVVDTKLSRFEVYDDLLPSRTAGLNAWISIIRGCDKFCTFCVVPFTRGRERSRSLDSIVAEAADAVGQGFPEITLLGQNVNSYRHDGNRFPDLLEKVAGVSGLRRLRFTSPHPSDVDEEMLQVMAAHVNICKSIHLPLQAGADRILERMNRTYTRADFVALADHIREVLTGCTLSTDIIVGFPGATREEFEQTLEVMRVVEFDSAFTFKFSQRSGTKAAEYPDQIAEGEKQSRLEEVIALQKQIGLQRNRAQAGRVLEVLVEKQSKKSAHQWAGRTDGNRWVVFDKGTARIKDFVPVYIDGSYGVALKGHLVGQSEDYHAVA